MSTKSNKKTFMGWALYDFANSLLYTNIILYFPQWVTNAYGVSDLMYNVSLTLSTIILILSAPFIGFYSDRSGKKSFFVLLFSALMLVASVLIPITAFFIESKTLVVGIVMLLLFVFVNYSYQMSLLFYNALLGNVAKKGKVLLASGIGISVGWLGAIVGILAVKSVAENGLSFLPAGPTSAILFSSFLFLLASIFPLLWLRKTDQEPNSSLGHVNVSFKTFFQDIKSKPIIMFFLIAYWLYIDAILTVQENLTLFLENVHGVVDGTKAYAAIILIAGGILGALLVTLLSTFERSVKNLKRIVVLASFGVFALALSPTFYIFLVSLFLVALALGAILTVSRSIYSEIIPKDQRGGYFVYYSIAERSGSIVGPLVWGGIVVTAQYGNSYAYQTALIVMAAIILLAILPLRNLEAKLIGEANNRKLAS